MPDHGEKVLVGWDDVQGIPRAWIAPQADPKRLLWSIEMIPDDDEFPSPETFDLAVVFFLL